jgi:DNA-binding beta-propeller fold protein YncE
MSQRTTSRRSVLLLVIGAGLLAGSPTRLTAAAEARAEKRYLYVASPGVRNYLEYGGHGVLVFDIDNGHAFVRRIPTRGLGADGKPLNVKGVCASAATGRLYISTLKTLTCIDLITDEVLWERPYDGGCDRMSITPDGKAIYLPSLEGPHWHVVDGSTGDVIERIVPDSGAHNTVVGLDGRFAYLAGLKSPLLRVADATDHKIVREVGPFGNVVRPFTVNGAQTLAYVNVNDLLGFEVGDLRGGKVLARVEVPGFKKGPVKRHGCPSHGVGLTPDETEVWVCDATNQRVHVFDNTVMPPALKQSVALRDEPGWVTFTLDGKFAYPSTGEVVDVKTKQVVAKLTDEQGRPVMSEKMLEIDFAPDGKPVRNGDQFGLGRAGTAASAKASATGNNR